MLVNGKRQTTVSIHNRGLAYGDGLFETIRLQQGRPVWLEAHLRRLAEGCRRLSIPECSERLREEIHSLQEEGRDYGILKVIVTRGEGGRGYRGSIHAETQRILSLHPLPDYNEHRPEQGIKAFISPWRLATQPHLAGLKHLNRLEQVLAATHWPDDNALFEGLMLDHEHHLIEGTRSNVFLARGGRLQTPALDSCGVAGILRDAVLTEVKDCAIMPLTIQDLCEAEEMFFCNSVGGVWPVLEITSAHSDGLLSRDRVFEAGPFASLARQLFRDALAAT